MASGKTFRSAIRWAFAMNWGQQAVTAATSFVLAAVLGPKDFGTVAMAAIYVMFIQMFVEQGLSAALIQRKDLETEHLDSVFWLTLATSLLLAAASVWSSPWWAAANRTPELTPVICVLSLLIPLQGLTAVQQAVLQREMDFRALAIRSNIAAILGGILAVAMALTGWGIWALVAQQLVTSAIATALLWRLGTWRPHWHFSRRHTRELLRFAAGCFIAKMGAFVNRRSDALLVGLFFGPVAVGLYRFADRIMNMILIATTRSIALVSLPHFSAAQDDREQLKRRFLVCLRLGATMTIPPLACVAAVSDGVMALVGPEWMPAAPATSLLCLVGIVQSLTLFVGPLLQARACTDTLASTTWLMVGVNLTGLVVMGMVLRDARSSEQTIGLSLLRLGIMVGAWIPVTAMLTMRLTGAKLREMGSAIVPATAAGLAAAIVARLLIVVDLSSRMGQLIALLAATLPAALASLIVLMLLDPQLRGWILAWLRPGPRDHMPPRPEGVPLTPGPSVGAGGPE